MTDLNSLTRQALNIAEARQKNGADVKTDTMHMLKHCATEVIEATEAYSRYELFGEDEDFISELADIICCVMIIAGKENIDLDMAIGKCIEKNSLRAAGIGDKK